MNNKLLYKQISVFTAFVFFFQSLGLSAYAETINTIRKDTLTSQSFLQRAEFQDGLHTSAKTGITPDNIREVEETLARVENPLVKGLAKEAIFGSRTEEQQHSVQSGERDEKNIQKGVIALSYQLTEKIAGKASKNTREDFIAPPIEEAVLLLGFIFGNWGYVVGRLIFVALHAFQNRVPPDGRKSTLFEKIFLPSLMSVVSLIPFIFSDPVSISIVFAIGSFAHILSNLYVPLSGTRLQKGIIDAKPKRNVVYILEDKKLIQKTVVGGKYKSSHVSEYPDCIVKCVWSNTAGGVIHGRKVILGKSSCKDHKDITVEYKDGEIVRVWAGDPYPENNIDKLDRRVPLIWQEGLRNVVYTYDGNRLIQREIVGEAYGQTVVKKYPNCIVRNVCLNRHGGLSHGSDIVWQQKEEYAKHKDITIEYKNGEVVCAWLGDPYPENNIDKPDNRVPVIWQQELRNVVYTLEGNRLIRRKVIGEAYGRPAVKKYPDCIVKNVYLTSSGALIHGGKALWSSKKGYEKLQDITIEYKDGVIIRVWAGDPYPENDITKTNPDVQVIWPAYIRNVIYIVEGDVLAQKEIIGDRYTASVVGRYTSCIVKNVWTDKRGAICLEGDTVGPIKEEYSNRKDMTVEYKDGKVIRIWVGDPYPENTKDKPDHNIHLIWNAEGIDMQGWQIKKRNVVYIVRDNKLIQKEIIGKRYEPSTVSRYPNCIVKNVWLNKQGGLRHGSKNLFHIREYADRKDISVEYKDGEIIRVWAGDPYPEDDITKPNSNVHVIWSADLRNVIYICEDGKLVQKEIIGEMYNRSIIAKYPDCIVRHVWSGSDGAIIHGGKCILRASSYKNYKDMTIEYKSGSAVKVWAGDPYPEDDLTKQDSKVPLVWQFKLRNVVYVIIDNKLSEKEVVGKFYNKKYISKYPDCVVKSVFVGKNGILAHGGRDICIGNEYADRDDLVVEYKGGDIVKVWAGDPYLEDDITRPNLGASLIWSLELRNVVYVLEKGRLVKKEIVGEKYNQSVVVRYPDCIVKNVWSDRKGLLQHAGKSIFIRGEYADRKDITVEYKDRRIIRVWAGDPYPEDDLTKPNKNVPLVWQAEEVETPDWQVVEKTTVRKKPSKYERAIDTFQRYHVLDLAISLSGNPEEMQQALAILLTQQGAEITEQELGEISKVFILNLREGQIPPGGGGFQPGNPFDYLRGLMALQEVIKELPEHEQFILMRAFVRLSFSRFARDFNGAMEEMENTLLSSDKPSTPFLKNLIEHVKMTLGQGLQYQPEHIRTRLLPHQRVGAWYMRHSEEYQKEGVYGFLLEDDTRLGKTIQSYAAIDLGWKAIVIVPAGVMDTWEEQYYQHTTGKMKLVMIRGNPEEKRRLIEENKDKKGIILLFSIEDIRARSEEQFDALNQGLDVVIVDEGQKIENYGGLELKTSSLQARAIHRLQCPRRWILSASPYTSHPKQLFSAFNLIHTDPVTKEVTNPMYSTRKAFNRLLTGTLKQMKWLYALKARIGLRRTKNEMGLMYTKKKEVDPEDEGNYTVTKEQSILVLKIIKNLGKYLEVYNSRVPDEERISARSIGMFLKLQFLNWALTDPLMLGEDIPTSYWDNMDSIIEKRLAGNKKGIVFAQNIAMIDKITKRYKSKGYKVARIDGTVTGNAIDEQGMPIRVSYNEKGNIVINPNGHPISAQAYQRYLFQNDPEVKLIVMNVRAGVGLDLSKADWELYAQLPQNYVEYYQSSDRALGLNQDPTGTQKQVKVMFMIPKYPKDLTETLRPEDQKYTRAGTPGEILYKGIMGEDKARFELVMEGIQVEKGMTEQKALTRLVHAIYGFLEDPSMHKESKKKKKELEASSALYPLYQKIKGDKILEEEVLTLVQLYTGIEISPKPLGQVIVSLGNFNPQDIKYISALFNIPNKQYRLHMLEILPEILGKIYSKYAGVNELVEKGLSIVQDIAKNQTEFLIPLVAITHMWDSQENGDGILRPMHQGADIILGLLENFYVQGLSDYEKEQWIKRYINSLISIIDIEEETILDLFAYLKDDLLSEEISLEQKIVFLEKLSVLKQSNPNAYNDTITAQTAFKERNIMIDNLIINTFIEIFDLPDTEQTRISIIKLSRKWGTLNAPLQLMAKLKSGDSKEYNEHVDLLKIIMRHIVAGTYEEWRNSQAIDPTGFEIAYLNDRPEFWAAFNREENISLGDITIEAEEFKVIRRKKSEELFNYFKDETALYEAFGNLGKIVQSDTSNPRVIEELSEELKIKGLQLGALEKNRETLEVESAIQVLGGDIRTLRTRLNIQHFIRALETDNREQIQRLLRSIKHSIQVPSDLKEAKKYIIVTLSELESSLAEEDKSKRYEDVSVEITSNPDLIMRRGMLAEDLKNCFNLNAGVRQIATLIDDLASRNKMLALVKVKGRVAAVAMLKIRQTDKGEPVIMIERPLYHWGYNFEKEIAEAIRRTKLSGMKDTIVVGDCYKGDKKEKQITIYPTGARGPTEYYETLFGIRERGRKVNHIAGVIVEAQDQLQQVAKQEGQLSLFDMAGNIDEQKEGISRVKVAFDGKVNEVVGIGHSTRKADEFIKLIKKAGIKTIVDVRTRPYSRFNPQYNKKALEDLLKQNGIEYVWLGEKLGGKLPEFNGDFSAYMKADPEGRFTSGIKELLEVIREHDGPVGLLCSEKDPNQCHRRFILEYLQRTQTITSIDLLDVTHKGAMKTIGRSLGKVILREVKQKQVLWRQEAERIEVKEYPIEINGIDGVKSTIFVKAKVLEVQDMPEGIIAWHFIEDKKKKDSPLVIVMRGQPAAGYFNELLYHEFRENYWMKEKKIGGRRAHILASAEQIIAFAEENNLTAYHEQAIAGMDIKQIRLLIKEYKRGRKKHHQYVEAELGSVNLGKVTAYEERLYKALGKKLQERKWEMRKRISEFDNEKAQVMYYMEAIIDIYFRVMDIQSQRMTGGAVSLEQLARDMDIIIQSMEETGVHEKSTLRRETIDTLTKVRDFLKANNEPAGLAKLISTINKLNRELEYIDSQERQGAHMPQIVPFPQGRGYSIRQGQCEVFELKNGSQVIIRTRSRRSFSLLWDALHSIVHRIESQSKEVALLTDCIKVLEKCENINDTAQIAEILREIAPIEEKLQHAVVSEKRMALRGLQFVSAHLERNDIKRLKTPSYIVKKLLQIRRSEIITMLQETNANLIPHLFRLAAERNRRVSNELNEIWRLINRRGHHIDTALRRIELLMGEQYIKEPDLAEVKRYLLRIRTLLISFGRTMRKEEVAALKEQIGNAFNIISESNFTAVFLRELMVSATQENYKESGPQRTLRELFDDLFKALMQKRGISRASEPAKIEKVRYWYAKYFQAVFVPRRINSLTDKKKQVPNPLFLASRFYLYMQRLNDLDKILRETNRSMFSGTLDMVRRTRTTYGVNLFGALSDEKRRQIIESICSDVEKMRQTVDSTILEKVFLFNPLSLIEPPETSGSPDTGSNGGGPSSNISFNRAASALGIQDNAVLKGLLEDSQMTENLRKTFLKLIVQDRKITQEEILLLVANIEKVMNVMDKLEGIVREGDKKEVIKRIALYLSIEHIKGLDGGTPKCITEFAGEVFSGGDNYPKMIEALESLKDQNINTADIALRDLAQFSADKILPLREYLYIRAELKKKLPKDSNIDLISRYIVEGEDVISDSKVRDSIKRVLKIKQLETVRDTIKSQMQSLSEIDIAEHRQVAGDPNQIPLDSLLDISV